jgi:3-isopropylmalate/(R)-2-methylmalate dehydratase small subunit
MDAFRKLEAVAAPLARANVDTDQIIPARFLRKPRSAGMGNFLFHDVRADPAFVLNRPEYRDARILVAGANFGCGSSREMAVWALWDGGFRAAIAPSYGDIFYSNALKNGFLPVVLPPEAVDILLKTLESAPGARLTVDLEKQTVGPYRFDIDAFSRHCLLEGIDELGYTLGQMDRIRDFERQHPR